MKFYIMVGVGNVRDPKTGQIVQRPMLQGQLHMGMKEYLMHTIHWGATPGFHGAMTAR
jgi:hypothetical protein